MSFISRTLLLALCLIASPVFAQLDEGEAPSGTFWIGEISIAHQLPCVEEKAGKTNYIFNDFKVKMPYKFEKIQRAIVEKTGIEPWMGVSTLQDTLAPGGFFDAPVPIFSTRLFVAAFAPDGFGNADELHQLVYGTVQNEYPDSFEVYVSEILLEVQKQAGERRKEKIIEEIPMKNYDDVYFLDHNEFTRNWQVRSAIDDAVILQVTNGEGEVQSSCKFVGMFKNGVRPANMRLDILCRNMHRTHYERYEWNNYSGPYGAEIGETVAIDRHTALMVAVWHPASGRKYAPIYAIRFFTGTSLSDEPVGFDIPVIRKDN